MSEINWYQCHLFYLLPLLLILCQETLYSVNKHHLFLQGSVIVFYWIETVMFSTWTVDSPLRVHPEGACSLPLCFRVTVLEKWCLCFSRWHSFLWPSCPWISDRVRACTSGITFLFFIFETMTIVLTKDSSLS